MAEAAALEARLKQQAIESAERHRDGEDEPKLEQQGAGNDDSFDDADLEEMIEEIAELQKQLESGELNQ